MDKDNLTNNINASIPKKLSDLITRNRDMMRLRYASAEDLANMHMDIPVTNLKGVLTQAFFYKRIVPSKNAVVICLVGFNNDQAFHTSKVVAYDKVNKVALTASGSHYKVKSFKRGAPDLLLLLHICFMFHRDGFGKFLGTPHVFY